MSNSLPNSNDSLQTDGANSETTTQGTPGASSQNPSTEQHVQDQNSLPKSQYIGMDIYM